ncbi:pyruvate formate-lyase-activating protein [uncultured Treponema sp.]|uniref:pyruvate formate-lyase-activating protein n=1 Tax=uncultured Treponema sp. TaxID=162155 RepID=UPI0025EEF928|nr:pyruvate formate-lyase-activating protein [uncultured Treponema sp.]
MQGYIHQLESFGSVDGPGVRFIIFFSGCPLRCKYCHNPDTWDMTKGKLYTADELLNEALSCRAYWGAKGGITVSGGEPLMQLDFLLELFTKAKEKGVNTCIDTAGGPFTKEGEWFEKFKKLMEVTDILLMDIKHIDEEEHIKLTGRTGKNIIEMFRYLDEIKKPIWIRHVLVPGITDNDEYLLRTRDFIRTLSNVQRVEILPYHGLGAMKYKDLGIDYVLKDTESPSAERVANAKKILECEKYDGWKK